MSFGSMQWELTGAIPGMSAALARTFINRAWREVRDSNLWSFQLMETGLFTPGLLGGANGVSGGTVTTTQGSPTVVGDATASAAWQAQTNPVITAFQFRVKGYSIYNVINFDGASTLTLDRPFLEAGGAAQTYQMYQAYYPAPVADFKRTLSMRDMFNGYWLDIWTPRQQIDSYDPMRLDFSDPTIFTGYMTDQRAGSATLGNMLFEMYPGPTAQITYMWYYVRTGLDLVNPTDTLPYPVTDHVVLEKAKVYGYEWAEARKDVMAAKGSGGNYLALMKMADQMYEQRCREIRILDREAVDAYMRRIPKRQTFGGDIYLNTVTGRGYGGW